MKAIVRTEYGQPDVLHLDEVAVPVPKDNEVLVKVHASSINPVDWHYMTGNIIVRLVMGTGMRQPKNPLLGTDIAGEVEAVGAAVKGFKPGDAVFGASSSGGFAEYACGPEDKLALKPANVSFEDVAAVPVAALTALQGLRAGKIHSGQKVAINGASGGVGTFAVQIAKALGTEVTAVCSTRNQDMARSIGADHVIDYTKEDFTKNGQHYDLIFAVNGYHPIRDYWRALSPNGVYVVVGGALPQIMEGMTVAPLLSMTGTKKLGSMGVAKIVQADLVTMGKLLEAGKVRPVIEKCYPLNEVADAMRYLGEGHVQGKLVITI